MEENYSADSDSYSGGVSEDYSSGGGGEYNESSYSGWVGEDGSFSSGWIDRLPGDLDSAKPTLSKYRSLPELAKAHYSLQQLVGRKSGAVQPLNERSTPEEIAEFRRTMGVPERPDAYDVRPQHLPEGVQWNDQIMGTFTQIAHKHHVPESAMREFTQAYLELEGMRVQEMGAQTQQHLDHGVKTLRQTWKGDYEKNLGLAVRVASTVGLAKESYGLTDPNVVIALAKVGAMMSEDKLVSGGDFSAMSKSGKARAQAIMRGDAPGDSTIMHLHEKYSNGDPETVDMVRRMLRG